LVWQSLLVGKHESVPEEKVAGNHCDITKRIGAVLRTRMGTKAIVYFQWSSRQFTCCDWYVALHAKYRLPEQPGLRTS